jgi:class 3 adenylate cyclase
MQSRHSEYVHSDSIARIDETLVAADTSFEELTSIPSRDRLTFNNGFYVKCAALFIDLRNSSTLPDKYKRPTLAKIYRSYISECVAVINGNEQCVEVNIHGDAVWGVFDTPKKKQVDEVFETAARLRSLVKTLNCRYKRFAIDPIAAGIGMSWGTALMIKAGHKGSTASEVVWMGDVVNTASKLSNAGAKGVNHPVMVSSAFHFNLNDHNKGLLVWNSSADCYHGNVINVSMEKWYKENCT